MKAKSFKKFFASIALSAVLTFSTAATAFAATAQLMPVEQSAELSQEQTDTPSVDDSDAQAAGASYLTSQAGIAQIVKGLNTVLNQNDDDVFIALETMAGKGSEIGRSFEELKAIYDGVDRKERLRVCFDTCHVNDAGYDIVNHYDEVFAEFDRVIGLEQIAVFHVNDSLNPLGAHKDRHANIGKGTIGYDTLHRLVHDETFANVPKILETPWLCEEGSAKKTIPPYKEEIEWLLK